MKVRRIWSKTRLFHYMWEGIARNWLSSLTLLDAITRSGYIYRKQMNRANRDAENEGAAAASAAALASPCKASIGALMVDRGSASSDSSSEEAAGLETMP
jgi:hypothetical protein